MRRQQYVGPITHLSGKTALVQSSGGIPGQVMAQFEEQYLKKAWGWWEVCETDFQSDAHAYAKI